MKPRARRPFRAVIALLGTAAGFAACGGIVVFDESGNDGGGGKDTVVASSAKSTGPGSATSCVSGEDCADDELCVPETRECRKKCSFEACDGCGPGFFCDWCATSSCEGCDDCVGACMPSPAEGHCDDDDPCPEGQACMFALGRCFDVCAGPLDCEGGTCTPCQAGSCCGCKDCIDVCR